MADGRFVIISYKDVLVSLRAWSGLESSGIEPLVLVDTTVALNRDATVDRVRDRLAAVISRHIVARRSQGGET
jgi:hypothetical protein